MLLPLEMQNQMKTLAIALMACLPLSGIAAENGGPFERTEIDGSGRHLIVRTSQMPDVQGEIVWIEQRLQPIGEDSFRYDYHDQSDGTNAYHNAYCAAGGLLPQQDGEIYFTGASSAWVCGISTQYGPDGEVLDE